MNPKSLIKLAEKLNIKPSMGDLGSVGLAGLLASQTEKGQAVTETIAESSDDIAMGALALGGLLVAPKAVSTAVRRLQGKGPRAYRSGYVSEIDNFLVNKFGSFYAGGIQKYTSTLGEVVPATARVIHRLVSPRISHASRSSGMSQQTYNSIAHVANEEKIASKAMEDVYRKYEGTKIAEGTEKAFKKKVAKEVSKETKPFRRAQKQLHHKVISDVSNQRFLFGDKATKKGFLDKYFSKYVKPTDEKNLTGLLGEDVFENSIKAQGIQLGKGTQYLQITSHPVQDVMRGMQFDSRAYNLFKELGKKNFKPHDVIKYAEKHGLNGKILKGGRVQVQFSPRIKSNFDWGGYNGNLIFDPAKPGKVTYFATDKRDLFGVSLGRDTINVSQVTEKSIPELTGRLRNTDLTKVQRHGPQRAISKGKAEEIDVDISGKKKPRGVVATRDWEILKKNKEVWEKALGEKIPLGEKIEFGATRLAAAVAVGGPIYYAVQDEDE
ncbi:hypothetical protein CMI47_15575 [Candidatus Pacearchaeota archaeon]|nr:hypothetical protein [Candidatus Pacearchaeota archaeon]